MGTRGTCYGERVVRGSQRSEPGIDGGLLRVQYRNGSAERIADSTLGWEAWPGSGRNRGRGVFRVGTGAHDRLDQQRERRDTVPQRKQGIIARSGNGLSQRLGRWSAQAPRKYASGSGASVVYQS